MLLVGHNKFQPTRNNGVSLHNSTQTTSACLCKCGKKDGAFGSSSHAQLAALPCKVVGIALCVLSVQCI